MLAKYQTKNLNKDSEENSRMELLRNVSLFSNLTSHQLEQIAKHTVLKSFPRRATLILEGENTDSMYIIVSGRVKAFLNDRNGKEVILTVMNKGSYFGEIALLDNEPRSASVMTLEKSQMLVITRKDFHQCLNDNVELVTHLLKDLTERIRELTDNIKSLALGNIYRRLINLLTKMAVVKDGRQVIEERLTQQELANSIGASREMVNKIFNDLIEGGYISIKKKMIFINKKLPSGW